MRPRSPGPLIDVLTASYREEGATLRVLSGRLKAVLVAFLATIMLIGVIGPAVTLAGDPPGLWRFMEAIGQVESGGDYQARNSVSGAYGKYQIMPANWPSWASRYVGDGGVGQTPDNQEIVASGKFRDLRGGLDKWRRVAYWWLTGSSQTTNWSDAATGYVRRVMKLYRAYADESFKPLVTIRKFSEKSSHVTYHGTWRSAKYAGYAGGTVRYATQAGASATFEFRGSRVIWFGPVGKTRGRARIYIDGEYLKTVNLYATRFVARKAVFSKGWSASARHTLKIKVVGTAGHPLVAIDQFVVIE